MTGLEAPRMARTVTKAGVVVAQAHREFRSFLRQRNRTIVLDKWLRGQQADVEDDGFEGQPFTPHEVTEEYTDLSSRTPTPWAGLVVKSLAQTLYVEGVRRSNSPDNMAVWDVWQRNGWDAKQISLHRSVIGHGLAFAWVMPGIDPLTGDKMAKMNAASAKRMAAFFAQDDDEWPEFAIIADPVINALGVHTGWTVQLLDETAVHYLSCESNGDEQDDWTYISHEPHGFRVCPVVQYSNSLDLDGKTTGEIEPVIPLLRRIDQTTFDRLIVQRFGAWKVRYIAGLAKPSDKSEQVATALRLKIEDLLISDNPETKFGTLDATDLKGFIESGDTDLRMLSAVTQTPPHHLLGLSSNLQAESLAAAQDGLMRKSMDFRMLNGENHEKLFRLIAIAIGNSEEARAYDMQCRWMDTESRSLVQSANALGIMATALKIPVEMLWERLPGWSDQDSERAKKLIESGAVEQLLAEIQANLAPADEDVPNPQGANGEGGSENEAA